jgi:exopolysaccharide biosynthesis protein
LTLDGVADLLVNEGAQYAVNLDGGGSSVMVDENHQIVSRPTCLDVPVVCERRVATILCIHYRN